MNLLHQFLEESASKLPGRPAVTDSFGSLTYSQLNDRANRIAALLLDLGLRRGDRAGIYMEKSANAVACIYAVLKVGAVYVPLDPQAPPARIGYIIKDCGITCLLAGRDMQHRLGSLAELDACPQRIVLPDARESDIDPALAGRVRGADALSLDAPGNPQIDCISLDLAYILYTSGSTGNPKGVMLSHQNAISFVNWAVEEFHITHTDRLSSHAPFHFDLSIFDLFAAAAAGAAVILVPPKTSIFPVEVARFIQEARISVWYSVPSILSRIAQAWPEPGLVFGHLRAILFAGEVFPTKYLRLLMRRLPEVRFCNLFGPTETNVCTWYELPGPPANDDPIPIGRAIRNVEVFAADEEGLPVKPGNPGELWVRGPTVMSGYWGDHARTAAALQDHPGPATDRAYKTGDLVVLSSSGDYIFMGRRDAQIKSRGYRIELGDVEAAIYAHPLVSECAVVAVADDLFTNRLHAIVVAAGKLESPDLVRFCSERIPRYMIPEEFEFTQSLPKTSTGKIDRQALTKQVTVAREGSAKGPQERKFT